MSFFHQQMDFFNIGSFERVPQIIQLHFPFFLVYDGILKIDLEAERYIKFLRLCLLVAKHRSLNSSAGNWLETLTAP